MVISIIFEFLKHFLIKDSLSDELVANKLYSQITSNITNEVLGFASFLELSEESRHKFKKCVEKPLKK